MRKFIANRIVKLLLNHGDLNDLTRFGEILNDVEEKDAEKRGFKCHEVRLCHEFDESMATTSAISATSLDMSMVALVKDRGSSGIGTEDIKGESGIKYLELPSTSSATSFPMILHNGHYYSYDDHSYLLATGRCHPFMLWVASLIIVRHHRNVRNVRNKKKKRKENFILERQRQLGKKLSLDVEDLELLDSGSMGEYYVAKLGNSAFVLAVVSLGLATVLVVLPSHILLLKSSLWMILVSILPMSALNSWKYIDPAKSNVPGDESTIMDKMKEMIEGLRDFEKAADFALSVAIGTIYYLAYNDLSIVRHFIHGTIFQKMGMSIEMVHFLQNLLSSFLAFFLFTKLFPRSQIPPATPHQTTVKKRKTNKFGCANAIVVQRMAQLAQEASARVEQRKKLRERESNERRQHGGKGGAGGASVVPVVRSNLTRSYSVVTLAPAIYEEEEYCSNKSNGRDAGYDIDRMGGLGGVSSFGSPSSPPSDGIRMSQPACPSSVGRPRKLMSNNYSRSASYGSMISGGRIDSHSSTHGTLVEETHQLLPPSIVKRGPLFRSRSNLDALPEQKPHVSEVDNPVEPCIDIAPRMSSRRSENDLPRKLYLPFSTKVGCAGEGDNDSQDSQSNVQSFKSNPQSASTPV